MGAMILTRPPTMVSVAVLRLYESSARTGEAVEVPVVPLDGAYTVDLDGTAVGRYYGVLVGVGVSGAPATYPIGAVDLPGDERLLVSPETLAVRADMALPLSDALREVITDTILAAQADVVAYLGQPIVPTVFTQRGCVPYGSGWDLTAHDDTDVIAVLDAVPETVAGTGTLTGRFTVVYVAGLDARTDPALTPIARYVAAHALNSPEFVRAWERAGGEGTVRTVAAEGQSITYEAATLGATGGRPGDGGPGSLPTLGSLDTWRVAGRRVHQAPVGYYRVGWLG